MSDNDKGERNGGDVNYYLLDIENPKRLAPYKAECEDIIEALGMSFAEGCAFKAIWRSCAARTLSKLKAGNDPQGVYDAQKVIYYGQRMLSQREQAVHRVRVAQSIKSKVNPHGKGQASWTPIEFCPKDTFVEVRESENSSIYLAKLVGIVWRSNQGDKLNDFNPTEYRILK